MRYAFLFPGQGSQKVGMGTEFRRVSQEADKLYTTASAVLGYDIGELSATGPAETLAETRYTQPALYVAACAALEALRGRVTVEPFAVAGHSVGEYAALYAASAYSFEVGLRLVQRRADLMHEAASRKPGGMAAVLGLDAGVVQNCCERVRGNGIVAIANLNCPGQVVVSGEEAALTAVVELLREAGAKRIVRLPVSGAFHSPLMVQAGDALYSSLREAVIRDPDPPVVVNVAAEYCRAGQDVAPFLTMQVSGTVRWEQSMRLLCSEGMELAIELGVGNILGGLMKRICPAVKVISVEDETTLKEAAGALAA